MKADFKKRLRVVRNKLRELQQELEELREDHENWCDEHDYGWEDTPTGERASDDQYNLQDACDTLEQVESDMDSNFFDDEE